MGIRRNVGAKTVAGMIGTAMARALSACGGSSGDTATTVRTIEPGVQSGPTSFVG